MQIVSEGSMMIYIRFLVGVLLITGIIWLSQYSYSKGYHTAQFKYQHQELINEQHMQQQYIVKSESVAITTENLKNKLNTEENKLNAIKTIISKYRSDTSTDNSSLSKRFMCEYNAIVRSEESTFTICSTMDSRESTSVTHDQLLINQIDIVALYNREVKAHEACVVILKIEREE